MILNLGTINYFIFNNGIIVRKFLIHLWHHQVNGHEFEQTMGEREGQGSLACCSPWGHKESDTTQRLNNKKSHIFLELFTSYYSQFCTRTIIF